MIESNPWWVFIDRIYACPIKGPSAKSLTYQPWQTPPNRLKHEERPTKFLNSLQHIQSISSETITSINAHDWDCKWKCHTHTYHKIRLTSESKSLLLQKTIRLFFFFFKSLPLTSAFPPKAFPPLKPGAKMNTNK